MLIDKIMMYGMCFVVFGFVLLLFDMNSLFVFMISNGDLTNWMMLVISMMILLPLTILIGKKISKDISKNEQVLLKNLFELTRYFDKKKIFEEKSKLSPIINIMQYDLNGSFIKQCRNPMPQSGNQNILRLNDIKIFEMVVDYYKTQMEGHYERLLGFTDENASTIRICIKNTLKYFEKLKHDNNCYYLKIIDCKMFVNDVDLILAAFKNYERSRKGFSIGVPSELAHYLNE